MPHSLLQGNAFEVFVVFGSQCAKWFHSSSFPYTERNWVHGTVGSRFHYHLRNPLFDFCFMESDGWLMPKQTLAVRVGGQFPTLPLFVSGVINSIESNFKQLQVSPCWPLTTPPLPGHKEKEGFRHLVYKLLLSRLPELWRHAPPNLPPCRPVSGIARHLELCKVNCCQR
jgi:hypothetical protein